MPKKFFIKGKDIITDPDAPVISDEFIDTTREEGVYQGQTIEVQADTKLTDDHGTGEAMVIRTYEFASNPEYFKDRIPPTQELFNSHYKGISALLWQDGLEPAFEIEPRFIFSKDRTRYMIMVTARPRLGQIVNDKTRTLTEILNDSRRNPNEVHGGVQLPSTKKKKTSRTA